ncbi:MAG: DUF4023 family protein [Bacillota bacterium]|nr:DUF4023 family protein [Bacillota bacterium]MDP4158735.1 DUF4023 family protein [Bacillota bacterium]
MDKIQKIIETQEKNEENKKHQGKGNPDRKLPNKQHSTNK